MSRLAQLKKSRGENLKQLQKKLEDSKQGGGGRAQDPRIWKPKFNKDKGKGRCVIRFLPSKHGDPFVVQQTYSFNGKGGNFYDLARRGFDLEDPVQIAAINAFRKAKAEGDQGLKDRAIAWLPKSRYFANIYVVKDEEAPENEGKVFIFEYGPAIHGFIDKAINPEFDDVKELDPFDLWGGADFIIRMIGKEIPDRKTGKKVMVPNYDESGFGKRSEFMQGDEEILEQIFEQTHDLSEFHDVSKVKSFDEVAERFEKVTGHAYNWLEDGATSQHEEKTQRQEEMEQSQEPQKGVDQHRQEDDNDDEPPFEPDQKSSEPDDEDPVAKFRRLASQSKK